MEFDDLPAVAQAVTGLLVDAGDHFLPFEDLLDPVEKDRAAPKKDLHSLIPVQRDDADPDGSIPVAQFNGLMEKIEADLFHPCLVGIDRLEPGGGLHGDGDPFVFGDGVEIAPALVQDLLEPRFYLVNLCGSHVDDGQIEEVGDDRFDVFSLSPDQLDQRLIFSGDCSVFLFEEHLAASCEDCQGGLEVLGDDVEQIVMDMGQLF